MPELLTIMGSGETSPTMVSVHRSIADRLPSGASAVLIETPYGFQENVADISAHACQDFARSVDLPVTVAPGIRGLDDADCDARDRGLAMVRTADWLFSGPGNPSDALRWWGETSIDQALHETGSPSTVIPRVLGDDDRRPHGRRHPPPPYRWHPEHQRIAMTVASVVPRHSNPVSVNPAAPRPYCHKGAPAKGWRDAVGR